MKIKTAIEFVIAILCSSPFIYTCAQAVSHIASPVSPSTTEPTAAIGLTDSAPSTEHLDHPGSREFDQLFALNTQISQAETDGDKTFLDMALAPMLVFRRTDGTIVDRAAFLANVKPSTKRSIEIESISFFGRHRALVMCVVTMDVKGVEKRFHNVRLFIHGQDDTWRLLAWANEEVS